MDTIELNNANFIFYLVVYVVVSYQRNKGPIKKNIYIFFFWSVHVVVDTTVPEIMSMIVYYFSAVAIGHFIILYAVRNTFCRLCTFLP